MKDNPKTTALIAALQEGPQTIDALAMIAYGNTELESIGKMRQVIYNLRCTKGYDIQSVQTFVLVGKLKRKGSYR